MKKGHYEEVVSKILGGSVQLPCLPEVRQPYTWGPSLASGPVQAVGRDSDVGRASGL
jgi:hypothetical protein